MTSVNFIATGSGFSYGFYVMIYVLYIIFDFLFRIKMVNVFGKHLSIDKLRTLILPKVRDSLYIRVGLNSLGWVS